MKKIFFWAALCLIFWCAKLSAENFYVQPAFIRAEIYNFQHTPGLQNRYLWSRMFGWGDGLLTHKNKPWRICWFAWADPEGNFYFTLSGRLSLIQLFGLKKINRQTIPLIECKLRAPDSRTEINMRKDWLYDYCFQAGVKRVCDNDSVLKSMLFRLEQSTSIKDTNIRGYFDEDNPFLTRDFVFVR